MTCRSIHCLLALGGFFTFAPAAIAQDQTPEEGRDVVIVTAQKQEASVQEIAASVSALGSEELEERGISSVDALQFAVPGLQSGTLYSAGGTAITIRGVGLNQGSPGVAVHVDGVYQSTSFLASLAQADLERVEILRGPQGTLYGRNANGGVVNFITRKPSSHFEAQLLAGYAEYDESHLQAIVNTPIIDGVRSRVVLDYANRGEGFTKNILGGQDLESFEAVSGRGALSIDLSDTAVLDLTFAAIHQTGPLSAFQLNSLPNANAIASNPYLATASFTLKPHTTTANDPSDTELDYSLATATLTWDLGIADLRSITSYASYNNDYTTDSDTTNISAFPQANSAAATTTTQELNLSSSSDVFDWVAGVYYLNDNAKSRLTFRFDQGLSGLPPGTYLENTAYASDAEAWAVYGDGSWHATDKLNVIAGVRYSEEQQHYAYRNVIGAIVGGQKFPFLNTCPARVDEPSFSSFTPRGGLQYIIDGDQNVYATVSKGFKSGGVNTNSCANEFNPEKITAYEAGYRSLWLNGDVTFNATAFYYDYTDLQLAQITGLVNRITNAAAAEVKGVEVELAWEATDNLSLNGSLSWLDAVFDSFDTLDTLDPAKGVQDLSGNRLPNAPEWSANLGIAYRWNPVPIGVFTARADFGYRSEVFLREFNQPLDRQAPYTLVNLSLIWGAPDEAYSIRAYVNNLSDEAYYDRMGSSDGFGARYVSYGAPRQAGVEFRARY